MQTTRDALQEGRQIIMAAKAEAARILTEAKAAADAIKIDAYNGGVADGKAQGLVEISQLEAARARVLSSTTDAIAEVVTVVVKELVPSISLELSQISHRLQLAIEQLTRGSLAKRLTLVIHSSARELIEQLIVARSPFPREVEYTIREDDSLGTGVCRIETATAVIESDIHLHAERIFQYLRANANELFSSNLKSLMNPHV